eukprot:PLAT8487.1.p1 GENE.PLAT8487.1~~PLAT8487.1.p1  ORF type:complete len:259 (+),score=105.23 PLAT8487.1:28-777(+)
MLRGPLRRLLRAAQRDRRMRRELEDLVASPAPQATPIRAMEVPVVVRTYMVRSSNAALMVGVAGTGLLALSDEGFLSPALCVPAGEESTEERVTVVEEEDEPADEEDNDAGELERKGDEEDGEDEEDSDDDDVMKLGDNLGALGGQVGFGTVAGFTGGYALKQVGKAAALAVGMTFCLVQGLAYAGYVKVHWKKVQNDTMRFLDTDNDGKLTRRDLKNYWRKLVKVMSFNMPSSAGFGIGLYLGLRWRG